MENKNELRNIFRAKRKQLSDQEREDFSLAITRQVLTYLESHPDIRHIHVFLPINKLREVNILPLIEKLLEQGLELYTSATDFHNKEMMTLKLKAPIQTVEDDFGIPVPINQEFSVIKSIDLVLIPLLAYDLEGNRLGYGMGFYDRFLHALPGRVVKAGVSFFPPEIQIPFESHDIKLDICFTAEGIHQF